MNDPIKVFSSPNASQAELVRAGLESAGLSVWVLGEDSASVFGGAPIIEGTIQVYVAPDDGEAAQQIVKDMADHLATAVETPSWTCPTCDEVIDGNFTECWNCAPPDSGVEQ